MEGDFRGGLKRDRLLSVLHAAGLWHVLGLWGMRRWNRHETTRRHPLKPPPAIQCMARKDIQHIERGGGGDGQGMQH